MEFGFDRAGSWPPYSGRNLRRCTGKGTLGSSGVWVLSGRQGCGRDTGARGCNALALGAIGADGGDGRCDSGPEH
jgi:hypothetical protein